MIRTASLLALGLCLSAPLSADELRLADGRVVVGTVAYKKGGTILDVTTRHGVVTVKKSEVVTHHTVADLQTKLQQLMVGRQRTAYTSFQAAQAAHRWGLEPEMWEHLDEAMARGKRQRSGAMQQRIREFLATLEPEVLPVRWRRSTTKVRVRELLYRIRPGIEPARRAAVVELLVREAGATAALRARARDASRHDQRLTALEALQRRRQTKGNLAFVYRSVIIDRNPGLRTTIAKLINEEGNTEHAIEYLAPGLMHSHPIVRMRTATAFGDMGDAAAAPVLVAAGPAAGKALADSDPGVRGHVAFLTQESYMRDFDVEVASASFIADPQVDVVQSGVVLDATVHSVTRQRVEIVKSYRRALKRIVGSDPGRRTDRWATWLATETEKAADRAAAGTTAKRGGAK